jgi:hypothetical protein
MRGDRVDLQRCDKVDIDVGGLQLHLPVTGIWDFSKLANRQLVIETPQSLKGSNRRGAGSTGSVHQGSRGLFHDHCCRPRHPQGTDLDDAG